MSGQGETITVWKCVEPGCDYWRDHKTTGVHMVYADRGPGKAHLLEAVSYLPAQCKQARAQRDRIREAGDELAAAIEMPWESLHEREQRLKRLDAALAAWRSASQDSPDA